MKTLILGGTHGDERTGVDVVLCLRRTPVVNVDTMIANPRATEKHKRFVETDLNRSFGVQNTNSYEERRALRLAKSLRQYDLIIEFHNTVSKTTCAILTAQEPTMMQLKTVAHLGLDRIVIMPAGGRSLSSRNPFKTVSFEISALHSEFSAEFFVGRIASLACEVDTADPAEIIMYRHHGVKVSKTTLAENGLKIGEFLDFQPISKEILEILGLGTKMPMQVPFLVGETAYGDDFAFNVAETLNKGDGA